GGRGGGGQAGGRAVSGRGADGSAYAAHGRCRGDPDHPATAPAYGGRGAVDVLRRRVGVRGPAGGGARLSDEGRGRRVPGQGHLGGGGWRRALRGPGAAPPCRDRDGWLRRWGRPGGRSGSRG